MHALCLCVSAPVSSVRMHVRTCVYACVQNQLEDLSNVHKEALRQAEQLTLVYDGEANRANALEQEVQKNREGTRKLQENIKTLNTQLEEHRRASGAEVDAFRQAFADQAKANGCLKKGLEERVRVLIEEGRAADRRREGERMQEMSRVQEMEGKVKVCFPAILHLVIQMLIFCKKNSSVVSYCLACFCFNIWTSSCCLVLCCCLLCLCMCSSMS